ncbi:hypothetical protein [Streptomyces zaehneri]|uniref:hypothetical protein n=1 Tax=Streptomyces zaehneri TaxID=3051180 RepID=UPI0028D3ED8F|nr:hypothetical protein [Streptomyces sp. DSM 40713]
MSQQHPQHDPHQPGRGGPQSPGGFPPPPKRKVGRFIGLGCAGIIGLFLLLAVAIAITGTGGGDDESGSSADPTPAASSPKGERPAAAGDPSDATKSEARTGKPKEKKVVTFKVWGTAPAGTLGPLDITYGSDSDTRKGTFANGSFEATLPLDGDAMYYNVTAQLQGSGDINCSVTVDGHTEKAHASGGYNICNAQANAGILGGWD